jgi:putative membrane protein insertion efficiency factor
MPSCIRAGEMKTPLSDKYERAGSAARLCAHLIIFYRRYLSCLKPRCCRFTPTCSEYGFEAFMLHGFWKGGYLTFRRILRCHPFYRGPAYDPVPPRKGASDEN